MSFSYKQKKLKKYKKKAKKIIELKNGFSHLTDEELREKTKIFKQKLSEGKTIDDIKGEAFAVVREAAYRVLGYRHYEVQIMGGLSLLDGNVAEMVTGEGKTLTITLPSYVRALEGKGVHIITVNEYLAKRDYETMGKVFRFLGLTVGLNLAKMDLSKKQQAYQCDITYGVGNEFGFDYLRDHHVYQKEQRVQRPFHYCVIDEIDSILIDEGRTPLILAAQADIDSSILIKCQGVISLLKDELHYEKDNESKTVYFTSEGIAYMEDILNLQNLCDTQNHQWMHRLYQALRANTLFKKNVDYIVEGGKVELVDKNTGRIMKGRSLSEGLHQAIEAKEAVEFTPENATQSLITIQNFFQKYPVLSGLSGTASTEQKEFYTLYNMDVIPIPTHLPVIRNDHPREVYATKEQKYRAIVNRIQEIYPTGRPILVGTTSIEQSYELAQYLDQTNVPFEVLNALSVEHEVAMISHAGKRGNVMIATNMAGRGTDIVLDPACIEKGGLYVIGTECHESKRVDRQLVGRAGRQGQPGDATFIVSLEDDLFVHYAEEKVNKLKKKITPTPNGKVEYKKMEKMIDEIQEIAESLHYSSREYLYKFNNVVNEQRNVVYDLKDQIILKGDLSFVHKSVKETIQSKVNSLSKWENGQESFDYQTKVKLQQEVDKLLENHSSVEFYIADIETFMKENEFSIRMMALSLIDRKWMLLIDSMETIRNGISNNQYAQEDPFRKYWIEAYQVMEHTFNQLKQEMTQQVINMYRNFIEEKATSFVQNVG